MNIQQAKLIPIDRLVEHLGGKLSHVTTHESWWYSPFRPQEKTASFKIHTQKNVWYDFGHVSPFVGQKSGGDILDLWCDYYNKNRRSGIVAALEALQDFVTIPREQSIKKKKSPASNLVDENSSPSQFKILKIHSKISYPTLKEELQRRRISLELGNTYLKQGYILDTKTSKTYNGFLFGNDKGGYEISIPNPAKEECIKRSTKPKSLSLIFGSKDETAMDIFEGFWDFLSWLEMNKLKKTTHHAIILNSLSFCREAAETIVKQKQQLKSLFLFMDNDNAGLIAMHSLAEALEPYEFKIGTREQLYKGYKDLNEYWQKHVPKNCRS